MEVVGAVLGERGVGGPLGQLAGVARPPPPARHLRRLAGDEALLGHDGAHDLLRGDDGRGHVAGLEVAPGDRLALPGAQVGGHRLGAVRPAARLEGGAHAHAQGGLGVGPRRPRGLVQVGALGYRERLGHVPEPHERAPLPRQLPGPPLLHAGQRGRAWCF